MTGCNDECASEQPEHGPHHFDCASGGTFGRKFRREVRDYEMEYLLEFEHTFTQWQEHRVLSRRDFRALDSVKRFVLSELERGHEREMRRLRAARPEPHSAPSKTQSLDWQYRCYTSGPWASYDVYDALNELEHGEERTIDGKTFKLVSGTRPGDKLFRVVNRPCGLRDLFPLADAVDFALRGELTPDSGFRKAGRFPVECEMCGVPIPFKRDRGLPGHHCQECVLHALCSECAEAHDAEHAAGEVRLSFTQQTLARHAQEHAHAVSTVLGLVPTVYKLAGWRPRESRTQTNGRRVRSKGRTK